VEIVEPKMQGDPSNGCDPVIIDCPELATSEVHWILTGLPSDNSASRLNEHQLSYGIAPLPIDSHGSPAFHRYNMVEGSDDSL
jgi:hypothetical protein